MSTLKRPTAPNAGFLPLLFLLAFLGSMIPAHIAFAGVVSNTQYSNRLPVALTVPIKRVQPPVKRIVKKKPVARLKIPSIKVNAVIKDMGVTSEGAMAIPNNRIEVGWYSSGTRPGDIGSAVVGGHNRWLNGDAVFLNLDQLKIGDVMTIVDVKGVSRTFVVRETRTFEASDQNSGIFESESGVHLNLITCSGVYDPRTKTYTQRLVIYTDAV